MRMEKTARVVLVDAADLNESALPEGILCLSRREKLKSLRAGQARSASVAAELAFLCALVFEKRQGEKYEYLPCGKPVLQNGGYMSLAHADTLGACVLWDAAIGLDLEFPREFPNPQRILAEGEALPGDIALRFCEKESYLKMTGEGLSGMRKIALEDGWVRRGGEKAGFVQHMMHENMHICLCTHRPTEARIEFFTWEEALAFIQKNRGQ